jgi:hypothetical protein
MVDPARPHAREAERRGQRLLGRRQRRLPPAHRLAQQALTDNEVALGAVLLHCALPHVRWAIGDDRRPQEEATLADLGFDWADVIDFRTDFLRMFSCCRRRTFRRARVAARQLPFQLPTPQLFDPPTNVCEPLECPVCLPVRPIRAANTAGVRLPRRRPSTNRGPDAHRHCQHSRWDQVTFRACRDHDGVLGETDTVDLHVVG